MGIKYLDKDGLSYLWGKIKNYAGFLNYYTKTQVNTRLSDVPDFVVENEDQQSLINEIDRVLPILYQALTDAGAIITPAQEATALANAKAQLANDAASSASSAATNANDKASYANTQGDYAKTQGQAAQTIVDSAKGSFPSLNDRLDYMENHAGTLDFVVDDTDTFPWR